MAAATTAVAEKETSLAADQSKPIVVELGKKSRKQIRQVREGTGKLMDEIHEVITHLRSTGAVAASAQPIVVVVKQRRRKSGLLFPLS